MSKFGKDSLQNPSTFTLWAEGISMGGLEAPLTEATKAMPSEAVEGLGLALWLFSHVYEFGFNAAIRDDGMSFEFRTSTYAGDPPEAYKAYQAALAKAIDTGDASDLKALAQKHPGTMAARQGMGGGGAIMTAALAGMGAAVAIPAFVKYKKLSGQPPAMEAESVEAEIKKAP